MIFGKDLGRSAFFAEIGSEVERLDSIPSNYTNLVCEYRIDLFTSPTGCIAVRLSLPLAGASPTDTDPKHLRRVASIVRAWSVEQLNEVCADHFYHAEGQAADIIDALFLWVRRTFAPVLRVSPTKAMSARLSPRRWLMANCSSRSSTQPPRTRSLPAANSLTASLPQKALTQTT